jgi:ribonuclease D
MTIRLHRNDLPDAARFAGAVAIDTETQGLNPLRDRLCLVQLYEADVGHAAVQRTEMVFLSTPSVPLCGPYAAASEIE